MATWMVAQDNFVADLKSGSSLTVQKGQVFAAGHEVVKLDAGRGVLFLPMDDGPEDAPSAKSPPRVSRGTAATTTKVT
jgi:hypothetical protein